ncbi:TIR domain-containing protein [candidate division KSB1 bacterium]|nr:TIR domain-containing protein [candidate division KSB1 bacterium]
MRPLSKKGKIITFYSYKGGTGRSMSLANIACLLAQNKENDRGVLMIDWDLEAPGLHRFFKNFIHFSDQKDEKGEQALDAHPGLIDFFTELDELIPDKKNSSLRNAEILDYFNKLQFKKYIIKTDLPGLFLLKAGKFDENYSLKVNRFQWEALYHKCPTLIQNFAEYLSQMFGFILIDSRTGITDIGGVCTVLMPEILVTVFTPNKQSLYGVLEVIKQATSYRIDSSDLRPLIVYPLASRIEASEPQLRETWRLGDKSAGIVGYQTLFEDLFKNIYELEKCDLNDYFNEVQIQHIPRYAYGEDIAVMVERYVDRFSLTASYKSFLNRVLYFSGPWEKYSTSKTVSENGFDDSGEFKKKAIDKKRYDVYFSYTAEIRDQIISIAKNLKQKGIFSWLPDLELRPGDDLKDLLDDIKDQIDTIVVFISSKGLSKWQTKEIDYFLKEEKRIIPVFIEETEKIPKLPDSLSDLHGLIYKSDDPETLTKLVWGITGKRNFYEDTKE